MYTQVACCLSVLYRRGAARCQEMHTWTVGLRRQRVTESFCMTRSDAAPQPHAFSSPVLSVMRV